MLIPYIGETGALIVAAVMMFVVAPLVLVAFIRWLGRPVRPRKAPDMMTATWREINAPWGKD